MAISPLNQATTPTAAVARLRNNADIIKHTAEPDISVGQKPLALLYKSAIEKLNEHLEAELGADAIGEAAKSGMDFSPEAVAERIVSFATGFFGTYAERHDDMGRNEQLDSFMQLIGGAIEQGFEEAREILDGLGVFQGQVADNANRTYELIQQKLAAFAEQARAGFEQEDAG